MATPPEPTPASGDDLRVATRAVRDAIAHLSRTLTTGVVGVGADVGHEIAEELNEASRKLASSLSRQSRREAQAAQTRADLIAAARRVFADKGYEAASVADLAAAAGYTKGALYAHFGSKQDLFLAAVQCPDSPASDGLDAPVTERLAGALPAHPDPGQLDAPVTGRRTAGAQPDARVTERLAASSGDLANVVLNLEAYLYALRHPDQRDRLIPLAEDQLDQLAAQIHRQRAGADGEVTRDDRDTAFALAALNVMGGIMSQILPAEADIPGAVRRMGKLLLGARPDE